MEYHPEAKGKRTTDGSNNIDKSQNNYAEWKKPNEKGYILYDFTYVKFQKMQTYLQ